MRQYDQKYKDWRLAVLTRDGSKCVRCGSYVEVQAHHKKTWEEFPELRYEVDNGESVCLSCHIEIHPFMVKYLKKPKNKFEKFLKRKIKKENRKKIKFKKFLKSNGLKGVTSKRLSSRYDNHRFTESNPNPNWA